MSQGLPGRFHKLYFSLFDFRIKQSVKTRLVTGYDNLKACFVVGIFCYTFQ